MIKPSPVIYAGQMPATVFLMPDEETPIDYKWRTIAADLERRIRSGELPRGTMLRVRGGLADEYDAGAGTIRRVIDLLADKGLVTKLPGSGTYVSYQENQSGE